MSAELNHYQVLGVDRDADPKEIRAAYHALVKVFHPDADGGSSARFIMIQNAYEVLKTPAAREEYDRQLSGESPPSPEGLTNASGAGRSRRYGGRS